MEDTLVNRKQLNPEAGPEAAYGARLRSVRERRGWKQDELAAEIGYSGRHISAVETARKPPTRQFSTAVDVVLKLDGTAESFVREWGEIRHGVLLEGFPEYLHQEARATEVRLFEVGVIPGVLQTREYASAIESNSVRCGAITADQAAERVQALVERQAALERHNPPMIFAVPDESCIRRPIGSATAMEAQLDHLVAFAELPHTVLQIAPYEMGERRSFNRSVNLLTLPDRAVVSYVESETQGHLDRELASVVPLVRTYHRLQAEALSQAASVEMIHQARKGTS
ncbi:helix-turn-helix domain-containing protein [Streptomyces spiramenti]|uniref:Helix-turn-helix domain-containing protein n=1 Tax=Streptomyces spiramenti TaxID=2720606 RepID=A0ABX1AF32_9ACTN|nr:helix-turn-helix transcriptional regulator [Streptomyces spiramenti]NJP65812.1 helix-turn-helix domain-containing protein [Streptomyces spiramenti]